VASFRKVNAKKRQKDQKNVGRKSHLKGIFTPRRVREGLPAGWGVKKGRGVLHGEPAKQTKRNRKKEGENSASGKRT